MDDIFTSMKRLYIVSAVAASFFASMSAGRAADDQSSWLSGDWYVTVGGAGFYTPKFEGADDMVFTVSPMISIGRAGSEARFSSRNDNISWALVDTGVVKAGLVGKILTGRDGDDVADGIDPVRWGGEVGGFVEVYPVDWLRVRGELRHGIRSHQGIVGDVAVDAFYDVNPTVRVSGGPRVSFASSDFFEAYYGVSAQESALSGIGAYNPGGGLRSAGIGGAITWKTTENVTTSLFGEYQRLLGPAADSTIVRERGSADQFTVGVSATYRFDFSW